MSELRKMCKFIAISFEQIGDFESHIMIFGGSALLFHMHSNVFDFPNLPIPFIKHLMLKEDTLRSFCGVINIYNFLSDSFKYNRYE